MLESPPLYDIVRDVNKLSNNVMARQIFLTLATTAAARPRRRPKRPTSSSAGLPQRKLAMPGLVLENGSGLSRHERNTAAGLNRLLIAANASSVREEFASSLAVAAVDGTVERRFQQRQRRRAGAAEDRDRSKACARSPAMSSMPSGRRFTVVAIVNDRNAARAGPALDYLVQWVYQQRRDVGPGAAALIAGAAGGSACTPIRQRAQTPGIGLLSLNSR